MAITRRYTANSALAVAVLDMLKAVERYFGGLIPGSRRLFDSSETLAQLVRSLTGRRVPTGEFASMMEQNHFKASYVHGDLNGNNLTWAAHYKRFVMIDFESVELGIVGLDQLKLFASMICETIPTARRRVRRGQAAGVTDPQHRAIVCLIQLVPWLIGEIIQDEDQESRRSKLDERFAAVKAQDEHVSRIAIAIIRTIDLQELEMPDVSQQRFWTWTIRNLFFRQFEYAYRSLDTSHVDALDAVRRAIHENATTSESTGNPYRNVLKDVHENNVIMLTYAFMALLATLSCDE